MFELTSRTEARQKSAGIKKKQAESLAGLPPNTLHISLYIRSDPPLPNDFHWAFYLHQGTKATPGGTKYHARGIGGGWIAGHEATAGIFAENFLCVVIQIATITPSAHGCVDEIMKSYDESLNSIPGITCRFVRCDIGELENDCLEFGNEHSETASVNEQPRPVVKSRVAS
ncbi:unnamed protein product [Penicillium glandicola]